MMNEFINISPRFTHSGSPVAGQLGKSMSTDFLPQFVTWSWVVLVLSSLLQCTLFFSAANLLAVGYVVVAWSLLTIFILRSSVVNSYPISCFFLVSFTLSQLYFPLVFTLIEGKKLVFNLELPNELFLHAVLSLIVLLIVHGLYRSISGQHKKVGKAGPKLLNRLGLFDVPTDQQIWIIGFFGLAAAFYTYFIDPTKILDPNKNVQESFVGSKFIQGFVPYMYAPFFIPSGRMYGQQRSSGPMLIPKLVLYTLLLFVVSIGANSRGAFMLGFTSLGFTLGLGMLLNVLRIKLFTIKNIGFGLLMMWLFTGPIADLGTAMVMVRGSRLVLSKPELIEQTWEAFQQKEAIKLFRQQNTLQGEDWDEYYLDNIFLARFCNLKFNDASLMLAHQVGQQNLDMLDFTVKHTLATLPTPLLNAMGFTFNKIQIQSSSYGDYLYYLATSDPEALGGFRTGHYIGTSMAAFGWWYLLVLAIGVIPIYILCDLLFVRVPTQIQTDNDLPHYAPKFSLCGLMSLTPIFQLLAYESLEVVVSFPLRGWIQLVLLYVLVFQLSRLISRLLPMGNLSNNSLNQPG